MNYGDDGEDVDFAAIGTNFGTRWRLRRLARDPSALALVRTIVAIRNVELRDILQPTRGGNRTARTRQLAMYLVHVLLGRPQDVVGELLGRDRTTVSHACHVMEDRRDNPELEAEIQQIERRFNGVGKVTRPEVSHAA